MLLWHTVGEKQETISEYEVNEVKDLNELHSLLLWANKALPGHLAL